MAKNYRIELDDLDLGQLLDGLEIRAESWEKTADFLRIGEEPDGEFFLIEECSDEEEADGIAGHFRSIIGEIRKQMERSRNESASSDSSGVTG
jgi:hypothetical protein